MVSQGHGTQRCGGLLFIQRKKPILNPNARGSHVMRASVLLRRARQEGRQPSIPKFARLSNCRENGRRLPKFCCKDMKISTQNKIRTLPLTVGASAASNSVIVS